MSKKLFHYTPVFHAVMILRDGVIRRSTGNTPPYVWLSSNKTGDPTACRIPRSICRRQYSTITARFSRSKDGRVSCSRGSTPSHGKACR